MRVHLAFVAVRIHHRLGNHVTNFRHELGGPSHQQVAAHLADATRPIGGRAYLIDVIELEPLAVRGVPR